MSEIVIDSLLFLFLAGKGGSSSDSIARQLQLQRAEAAAQDEHLDAMMLSVQRLGARTKQIAEELESQNKYALLF